MGLTSSKNALDPGNAAVEAAAGPSRKRRGKKRKANVVEDPVSWLPNKKQTKLSHYQIVLNNSYIFMMEIFMINCQSSIVFNLI